ncbi:MAG: 30S ribosomal protein S6 [Bacteroidetes bacterium GWE2_29_8]|nr:MAG: 30S ribosomal protein S6 [Bacteroidetes bacterium GWE2_29_8]OFY24846.1 MAG: 30S ribosomal protein S6 [Bacteroidetes bacterium GWF2_29_10]
MNQYETVFILNPVLSDDQVKEAVEGYVEFLEKKNCEIIFIDKWGLKKLAYPIKKKNNGFYNLIEFRADSTVVADLEISFKRDERILRFLTVKLDKYAVDYNYRKRNNMLGKSKIAKEAEEVNLNNN